MKHITILMGSESDRNIADKTIEVLEKFAVPYNLEVASAHREPNRVRDIVRSSQADVFICIAGLAAALPGFVASLTPKPVIGVPKDVKLGGLDALLAIAQMPSGIPVATVGIDNGKNAAYLAIRILGLQYPETLRGEGAYTSSSQTPGYSSESSYQSPGIPGSDESSSSGTSGGFPGGMLNMFSEPTIPADSTETTEKPKKDRPTGDWL